MLLQLFEVTVMLTMQETDAGVPVMVKSLLSEVELRLSVKKGVALAGVSGLAITSMVTPAAGMPDVIVTFKGKPGPGEGGSTWVLSVVGVVVTRIAASLQPPVPELFLQLPRTADRHIMISKNENIFLIYLGYCFRGIKYNVFKRV